MERIEKMKDNIQEYRVRRAETKRDYLTKYKTKIETDFVEQLNILVRDQLHNQPDVSDRKLSNLFMCRLKSSEYTGSYESILGLSCSQPYLDDQKSQLYWRPPYLYDNLDKDMGEVEKYLRKNFIRIEKYELFRLQQQLLYDDWQIWESIIPELAERNREVITHSPLHINDEILVVSGDYMERLKVIGYIKVE